MWLFKRKKTVTPPESPPEPHPMTISDEVVAEAGQKPQREFVRYEPLPGVIPEDIRNAVLAMDSTPYDTLNSQCPDFVYGGFPGYPVSGTSGAVTRVPAHGQCDCRGDDPQMDKG